MCSIINNCIKLSAPWRRYCAVFAAFWAIGTPLLY